MRHALLLAVVVAAGCRPAPVRAARDSLADSTDPEALSRAPVIREATVVAFSLAAADSLREGHGAEQLEDFRSYTRTVAPRLAEQDLPLVLTNADSIIVELEGGPTRVINLRGLDFPFGYVLVEPGFPESILTGVSTEEELLEEVAWYFGLDEPDDREGDRRQVVLHARPNGSVARES